MLYEGFPTCIGAKMCWIKCAISRCSFLHSPVSQPAQDMIPQNENDVPEALVLTELSWLHRMQQKLETLCETDAGRNSSEVLQETSTFLENQFSTLGTNVRKFCAEFVQELLLPSDSDDKCEVSRTESPQNEAASTNSAGAEKSLKLIDSPVFHLEGPSAAVMPVIATKKPVQSLQAPTQSQNKEEENLDEQLTSPLIEAPNCSSSQNSYADSTVYEHSEVDLSSSSKAKEEEGEEYALWFVSEEYRKMRLGKSSSTSSVESWDGHQRVGSSDSLLDWELV
ncbi:hypothetical protein MPTK1_3g22940 [Marchantia polymorpha subsp. ruderalis]|uniref:Uncharacterized protein n=2 Tax=Marchantia polymorpha TaxID=3197 RepID=A0AAF6B3S2_MARPO|nr:hypothetical protein MARPO_0024s0071 [Marchantia polymorpha]BBN06656.1 hypothetical protein Mp_3g22940 [Marchantia polymorpha subsp. ruderalis]|eukprot:PTQ43555.1 hypothetical protein MARPO_0024s0071 [Marchantia polymorpha]